MMQSRNFYGQGQNEWNRDESKAESTVMAEGSETVEPPVVGPTGEYSAGSGSCSGLLLVNTVTVDIP